MNNSWNDQLVRESLFFLLPVYTVARKPQTNSVHWVVNSMHWSHLVSKKPQKIRWKMFFPNESKALLYWLLCSLCNNVNPFSFTFFTGNRAYSFITLLYSINSAVCRPSDHTVGRPQTNIRGRETDPYRPPHLLSDALSEQNPRLFLAEPEDGVDFGHFVRHASGPGHWPDNPVSGGQIHPGQVGLWTSDIFTSLNCNKKEYKRVV